METAVLAPMQRGSLTEEAVLLDVTAVVERHVDPRSEGLFISDQRQAGRTSPRSPGAGGARTGETIQRIITERLGPSGSQIISDSGSGLL